MTAPRELIRLQGLRVRRAGFRLDVNEFVVCESELVAILGKSGCGKSTLLTFLGLLVTPDRCRPATDPDVPGWEGVECESLDLPVYGTGLRVYPRSRASRNLERIRRKYLGFALQGGELIPSLTLRKNVSLALELDGHRHRASAETRRVLADLGLSHDKQESVSSELSGGERQRGVFARAIAHGPKVVLLDEPTSALDELTAHSALDLLVQHARSAGQAVVMVTHDEQLARAYATRTVRMRARYPLFDGMVRKVLFRVGAPEELVRDGPDLISEEEYVGLIPREDSPSTDGLAEQLVAASSIIVSQARDHPNKDSLLEVAREVASQCQSPKANWEVEGKIFSVDEVPRVTQHAGAPVASATHLEPAHLGLGVFIRLGWRDSFGPCFARLHARLARWRAQLADSQTTSKGWNLQLGFFGQLVGNSAVVTAIGVLIVVLMGMKNGLVEQFHRRLVQDPLARQLVLTPASGSLIPDDLQRLERAEDIEMVIPAISGLLGNVTAGSAGAEGVTFRATTARDPALVLVYPEIDFSDLALRNAVLPTQLAEDLGVGLGESVRASVGRLESRTGDRASTAAVDLEVLAIVDADPGTMFIHADLADAMLDFKEGRAVSELDWPAFARAIQPKYHEYLIFTQYELSPMELISLRHKGLGVVEELPEDHSARSLISQLDPRLGDTVQIYCAYGLWEGEKVEQTRSTSDIEAALTDSDSIVLPWNDPLDVRIGDREATVFGLSGQPRWLGGYLPDPSVVFSSREPSTVLRSVLPPTDFETTALSDSRPDAELEIQIPVGTAKPPAAPELALVGPAELLANLHQWKRKEADYDPASGLFVPAHRGRHYYRVRAFATDVYQVPGAHDRLGKDFLIDSNYEGVNQVIGYVNHLDILVRVLQSVALIIAVLATTNVLTDVVLRKQAVIGMLRVMGMPFLGVVAIVIVRAILISAIALVFCVVIANLFAFGINFGSAHDQPCVLESEMFWIVGGGILACCLAGALLPLRIMQARDPLECLRRAAQQR